MPSKDPEFALRGRLHDAGLSHDAARVIASGISELLAAQEARLRVELADELKRQLDSSALPEVQSRQSHCTSNGTPGEQPKVTRIPTVFEIIKGDKRLIFLAVAAIVFQILPLCILLLVSSRLPLHG